MVALRKGCGAAREAALGFLVRFGCVEVDRKELGCSGYGCETA